jgi:hypothetical protein
MNQLKDRTKTLFRRNRTQHQKKKVYQKFMKQAIEKNVDY